MLSGVLPVLLFASIIRPIVPADVEGASRAFARYVARAGEDAAWTPESIEIEAALPKQNKRGTFRAIRRTNAAGEIDYEILEIAGDRTVRQQVINRYLTAQITAAEIPSATVAVTPANYNFRYKGVVKMGGRLAYIFQITPHKKRLGLIRGELWLDAETGAAVRQSGQLVKSPSLFIKRVGITRERILRAGVVAILTTHLSIDTRLAGEANLTVTESPLR